MPQNLTFYTNISGHTPAGHLIRGHKLEELISKSDFVGTFFLMTTGRVATTAELKVLNAILVASIDHGIEPASGFVPRVVAAAGGDILPAMASTLLALGPYHGGAITCCMEVLQQLLTAGDNKEAACENLVKEYRHYKKRLPGYGHPIYKEKDPRTHQLFTLAHQAGFATDVITLAEQLELSLEQELGKKLVLNVDGAIATLLMTMGFDPLAGNAIFGLARVAGSIPHIIEEQRSDNWVRRLDPEQVVYEPDDATS